MHSAIEVTKYNPQFRDENGAYLREEWTDYSDIGQKYYGKIFEYDDYVKAEQLYITAAKIFFSFYKCEFFTLKGRKTFEEGIEREEEYLHTAFDAVNKKRVFNTGDLEALLKLMFRGFITADLQCKSNSEIVLRFSYDYYMFFNGPQIMEVKTILAKIEGLYIR